MQSTQVRKLSARELEFVVGGGGSKNIGGSSGKTADSAGKNLGGSSGKSIVN